MKLITKNADIEKNLFRLINKYQNIAFAVAWASNGTRVFESLCNNRRNCIRKAVIGTHFYQTHPDVLESFIESKTVKFIFQKKGVFHPKIFIFWDDRHWEALIGSANLTNGALTINSEAMLLISEKDSNVAPMKNEILQLIESYWSAPDAESMSASKALSYRNLWKNQQSALKRISGQYGQVREGKAPFNTKVMGMSWAQFFDLIRQDPFHGFEERCSLLALVQKGFQITPHFHEMGLGLRKTIAGLPTEFHEHWAWFGSMNGAGYFHQAVNNNNMHLSKALDQIPFEGSISREHYNAYLEEFLMAFPNGRDGIGTASRLLSMKRPDYFVCFDSKNKEELCKDLGIKRSGMNYERYWEEIIERIMGSVWWDSPRPDDKIAGMVWDGRAAMLDAIFYKP